MWLVGFNSFWHNYSIRFFGTKYEIRIWKRLRWPIIEFIRWHR